MPKALSTLSQKSETRRKVRQSHFSATVWTGYNAIVSSNSSKS